MAFEQIKQSVNHIPSQVEDLVNSNLEYYKLSLFRLIVKIAGGFVKVFVVGMALLLFFFFAAMAAAFGIGKVLESTALGFVCVGGIFLLIALLIYLLRGFIIDRLIISKLSDFYFDEEEDGKDDLLNTKKV